MNEETPTCLWEILVPTEKPIESPAKKPSWYSFISVSWRWFLKRRHFSTRYHREWDAKVVAIANGLTVLHPAKGTWISPGGEAFRERMIPARVACTRPQIEVIMGITAEHYKQQAIMAYKVSDEVLIKHFAPPTNMTSRQNA